MQVTPLMHTAPHPILIYPHIYTDVYKRGEQGRRGEAGEEGGTGEERRGKQGRRGEESRNKF